MKTNERLCVVIPVYNERDSIGAVLEKWHAALDELGIDHEIRPYDDGSKDDSLSVMQAAASRLGSAVSVRTKANGGHGHTILTGYREAAADGFDWVFQVDSDDEMGPERFGDLWSRRNDFDFLVGRRDGRKQALPRKIVSAVSRLCVRVFYGRGVWDVNAPYRLMRVSSFAEFFSCIPSSTFAPNVILSGLAAASRLRCFEMPVPQHDRTTGEVSIKKWKLFKAAATSFAQTISFSLSGKRRRDEPIASRLFRIAAVAGCLFGMAFALYSTVWRTTPLICLAIAAIGAIVFATPGLRRLFRKAESWIAENPRKALSFLIVAALVEWIAFYFAYARGNLSSLQNSDNTWFWKQAGEMAAGGFPETKSWVTVFVYSLVYRVFGDNLLPAVCLNEAVRILAGIVLLVFTARTFGLVPGFAAAFFFLLSPLITGYTFVLYGEIFYYCLLLTELLFLDLWFERRDWRLVPLIAVAVPATLWTRGDGGILLLVLVPALLAADLLLSAKNRRRTALALVVFSLIVSGLLAAGYQANRRYHGLHTFLCSHDNWWPRLYGWCVEKNGQVPGGAVKRSIKQRFEAETGRSLTLRSKSCPEELVPYVKAEIKRRKASLSFRQKAHLIAEKESFVWQQPNRKKANLSNCLVLPERIFRATVCIGAFLSLLLLVRRYQFATLPSARKLLPLAPLAILAGSVLLIALAEANPRYGVVAYVLLPFYSIAFSAAPLPRPVVHVYRLSLDPDALRVWLLFEVPRELGGEACRLSLALNGEEIHLEDRGAIKNWQQRISEDSHVRNLVARIPFGFPKAGRAEFSFQNDETRGSPAMRFNPRVPIQNVIPCSFWHKNGWIVRPLGNGMAIRRSSPVRLAALELRRECAMVFLGRPSLVFWRWVRFFSRPFLPKDIWLLSDRLERADDNAEAFFTWLCGHRGEVACHPVFVLSRKSPHWDRLRRIGPVVATRGFRHKVLFLAASHIVMAYTRPVYHMSFPKSMHWFADLLADQRRVYLGHGIIKDDMSMDLNQFRHDFRLFVTSTKGEFEAFRDIPEYGFSPGELALTGRPRYDFLEDRRKPVVTIVPTWRNRLFEKSGYLSPDRYLDLGQDFEKSDFFRFYQNLLTSRRLLDETERLGYRIQFLPHPRFFPYLDRFRLDSRVRVFGTDVRYREIYAESSLMVTDWSSAIFDFAYLKKPVLYAQFDPGNYERGYFDYARDGFGEVETTLDGTIDRMLEYIRSGCVMKPIYRERVERFFAFTDHDNCRRVYEAILARDPASPAPTSSRSSSSVAPASNPC